MSITKSEIYVLIRLGLRSQYEVTVARHFFKNLKALPEKLFVIAQKRHKVPFCSLSLPIIRVQKMSKSSKNMKKKNDNGLRVLINRAIERFDKIFVVL